MQPLEALHVAQPAGELEETLLERRLAADLIDGALGDLERAPWMILAFGAAMVVGNILALVRPAADGQRAPVGRAAAMIVVGAIAAVWGAVSLLS